MTKRPAHGIIAAYDYLAKRGRVKEQQAETHAQLISLLIGMAVLFGVVIYAA